MNTNPKHWSKLLTGCHYNRCKTASFNRSLLRREESEENEINEFLEEFLGCIMSATDPAEPDRKICHHIL
jgi:hypothetical protein